MVCTSSLSSRGLLMNNLLQDEICRADRTHHCKSRALLNTCRIDCDVMTIACKAEEMMSARDLQCNHSIEDLVPPHVQ